MSPLIRILVAASAVGLTSVGANARVLTGQGAKAYCTRLTNVYQHYVGSPDFKAEFNRDAIAGAAVAECKEGHPAIGIPVLELKLEDAKMPLPPPPPDLAQAVR